MDTQTEQAPKPAFSIHAFATEAEARAWRASDKGAGGFIFVPEDGGVCWNFPLNGFTPTVIFLHPLTRGKNGRLV